MKSRLLLLIFLICIATPQLFAHTMTFEEERGAADVAKERFNYEKSADNLKFQNGAYFIKLELMDKAVQELQEYLEIYTGGIHRHDAYRLLGNIYFQRFDYQKAIKMYLKLYEEFGVAEEGIGGYFSVGMCYQKMGFDDKAIAIFHGITEDYPQSGFAYQAQVQLDLLNILYAGK